MLSGELCIGPGHHLVFSKPLSGASCAGIETALPFSLPGGSWQTGSLIPTQQPCRPQARIHPCQASFPALVLMLTLPPSLSPQHPSATSENQSNLGWGKKHQHIRTSSPFLGHPGPAAMFYTAGPGDPDSGLGSSQLHSLLTRDIWPSRRNEFHACQMCMQAWVTWEQGSSSTSCPCPPSLCHLCLGVALGLGLEDSQNILEHKLIWESPGFLKI